MKRTLTAAIVAALIALPTTAGARTPSAPEPLGRWPAGPCSDWRFGEYLTSPAKFYAHPERSYRKMRRLAACLWDRFDVPGDPTSVIDRESGWNPWATNPADGSSCRPFTGGNYGSCGLGQHLSRYWEGRMRAFLPRAWFRRWPVGPLDPRANLIVTARMWKAQGGACPAWCVA